MLPCFLKIVSALPEVQPGCGCPILAMLSRKGWGTAFHRAVRLELEPHSSLHITRVADD
jgi:hypothetical protein